MFSIAETPVFPDNIKEKETPTPVEDIQLESSIPHTDSGIGEEQIPSILNGTDLETSTGPDAMSELLSTLSSEVKKSQESLIESPTEILKPASSISSISQSKGINVKEILKSLVAAPVEIADCGPDPIPYPDPALKREAQPILPMQFHSFDRYMAQLVHSFMLHSLSLTLELIVIVCAMLIKTVVKMQLLYIHFHCLTVNRPLFMEQVSGLNLVF